MTHWLCTTLSLPPSSSLPATVLHHSPLQKMVVVSGALKVREILALQLGYDGFYYVFLAHSLAVISCCPACQVISHLVALNSYMSRKYKKCWELGSNQEMIHLFLITCYYYYFILPTRPICSMVWPVSHSTFHLSCTPMWLLHMIPWSPQKPPPRQPATLGEEKSKHWPTQVWSGILGRFVSALCLFMCQVKLKIDSVLILFFFFSA